MKEEFEHLPEGNERKLAIMINATKDVGGEAPLELHTEDGDLILFNPFELVFENSTKAQMEYENIFRSVQGILDDKKSTKLTVYSHHTNIDEIKAGKTTEFKIFITIFKGGDEYEFNIGKIISKKDIEDRLKKTGLDVQDILNIGDYGLEAMQDSSDNEGYDSLFSVGTGGGTHNISSTLDALLKASNSDSLVKIAPKDSYTIRTSLFGIVDGLKVCIRTDSEKKALEKIKNMLLNYNGIITEILDTNGSNRVTKGQGLDIIPSNFDKYNVIKGALTVVFNGEDRETGAVIRKLIDDAELFLDKNECSIKKRNKILNLKRYLENSLDKLESNNIFFSRQKNVLKNSNEKINSLEGSADRRSKNLLQAEKSALYGIKEDLLKAVKERRAILKESLFYLVKLTKKLEEYDDIISMKGKVGRINMITDGEKGSVGVIDVKGYEIFFENLILEIGTKEKKLFKYLKEITKGIIDIETKDTTGCGDSSITACLLVREGKLIEQREKIYKKLFKGNGLNKKDYSKAIAISEAFFLSNLQKIISGTVYHCRRPNLGDIENSTKVANALLDYAFAKTKKYIRDGENGINLHLYGIDSATSRDKKYNWFNVYGSNKGISEKERLKTVAEKNMYFI